jgi:pectate lyase
VRPDGSSFVPVNFANQQHLMRLLVGLSAVTGEERYVAAARAAAGEFWRHGIDASGLWFWGGHATLDQASGECFHMEGLHELKTHFPFFEWLLELDAGVTRRFIESFWCAHIQDWTRLDLDRHGRYGSPLDGSSVWDHPTDLAPVFFTGKGLSFVNTGCDLIHAAAHLHLRSGDSGPLRWAKRLALRYVETRHPGTGIPGYQFSQIAADRGVEQLGPEFGRRSHEFDVLDRKRAERRFCRAVLCLLQVAERLGPEGGEFADWACGDLVAWLRVAHDAHTNRLWAVLRDGTRLGPQDIRRPGYYTADDFASWDGDEILLWTLLRSSRAGRRDDFLLERARAVGRALGFGNLTCGDALAYVPSEVNNAACLLEAMLEICRLTGDRAWLVAAQRTARQFAERAGSSGLLCERTGAVNARLGAALPLAILRVATANRYGESPVPPWLPGDVAFTALSDGGRRANDNVDIFSQFRRPKRAPR